jgi:DNA-binding GntR family transcriptional regulator
MDVERKARRSGRSIKPSRSSASEAYDLLLTAIESGGLRPGTRLREAELADRFDLSRTPVREALKRLEAQGLVAHEPHHGAVVATLDYGQMIELYFIREILEGTAARLAAIHATATEIDVLREMIERDRTLVDDPRALARTNRLFHQQVRNSARNRFLAQALETLRLSLALLAGTTLGAPGRGTESVDEHAAIVARIAARDPEGADAVARTHIQAAFRTRLRLLQEAGILKD